MPLTVLSVGYPLARVSPGTAGGAEQVLLAIDEALVDRGHRSLVLAAAGSRCRGLLLPVSVPESKLDESAKDAARRSFRRAIDRALDEFPIDVVHMHGLDFHEYLPERHIPVVVSLHLPLSWYQPHAFRLNRSNVALVCVSRAQARTAAVGAKAMVIIPNGINLENFRPARHKGDYALVLGRICPEKGIHLALDAARSAGVKIVVAGAVFGYREHEDYFQSTVQPRLGNQARFLGPVGGERKAQLVAGAKCLLIPSLAPETSSLAAMEALSCETPVIAWRSGALPEIVEHEKTGFLVSTVDEMAEAIRRVEEISQAECRRDAHRRFSAQQMASAYLSLYEKLIPAAAPFEVRAA